MKQFVATMTVRWRVEAPWAEKALEAASENMTNMTDSVDLDWVGSTDVYVEEYDEEDVLEEL